MSNGVNIEMMENGTGNGDDVLLKNGGKYNFSGKGTTYGTIILQQKDLQGNYLPMSGGTHSADGVLTLDLASGTYRVVATTTATDAYLTKV